MSSLLKGGVRRGPLMLGMEDCGPARGAGRWLVTMGPPRVGLRKTAGARPGLCSAGTRTGPGPGARTGGLVTGARAWLSTPPWPRILAGSPAL